MTATPFPTMATLTVAGTSIGLDSCVSLTAGVAAGIPKGAKRVFITCRTADVFWTEDGTAATASSVATHTLSTDERMAYGNNEGESISRLRFIRSAGTSATLVVTFR